MQEVFPQKKEVKNPLILAGKSWGSVSQGRDTSRRLKPRPEVLGWWVLPHEVGVTAGGWWSIKPPIPGVLDTFNTHLRQQPWWVY